VLIVAAGMAISRLARSPAVDLLYTQLTDLTDAAVAPALSRDGRMIAFIRGEQWFGGTDQIYLKRLPNGEAVPLTNDPRRKYNLAFSPDGSRIAYTVWGDGGGWKTDVVSVLGGDPKPLLPNAAGLTWLDDQQLLFGEIKTGMHLGIVTATISRAQRREVYFPQHERAMAHYAFASPDRRWALVIEMDHRPVWQPCRLVPMDGSSRGRTVGPDGMCTGAGWSPDGAWMYFTAEVNDAHHLWRQRFPAGNPEQLTFGPSQEDGVAVTQDGAVITSIGVTRTALSLSDTHRDRTLTSEGTVVYRIGDASLPSFAPDGRSIYYLRESPGTSRQLWRVDVESGHNEPILSGRAVAEFDISADGSEVVFSSQPRGSKSQLWLARIDGRTPPVMIADGGENAPRFGPTGGILFRYAENNINYGGQMNRDGSARSKLVPYPVGTFMRIAPDRRWLAAIVPEWGHGGRGRTVAIPTTGGAARAICINSCWVGWSPNGKFLYVASVLGTRTGSGRTFAFPVVPDTGLPDLPTDGVDVSKADAIPGTLVIEQGDVIPGLDPSTYAYVRTTAQRNLFQIRLR
jgi:Tol biopolymer transport system component